MNSMMRDTSQNAEGVPMTPKVKRSFMAIFQSRRQIPTPTKETTYRTVNYEEYESLVSGFNKIYMEVSNNRKVEPPVRHDSESWNYTWLHDYVQENSNASTNLKPRKDEPQHIANQFIHRDDTYTKSADPHSLCLNIDIFPPRIESDRSASNLKPVFVDGCAVVQLYNPEYCPFFDVDRTADLPYTHCYKLNVAPLVKIAMHFLIRGHKVIIYLPKYYENLYWLSFPRMCKVDDPDTFEVLRRLELLEFIEPVNSQSLTNEAKFLSDVMRERVKQMNACFVSSPSCERMYDRVRTQTKPPEYWNDERMQIDEADLREKAMLTPYFFGPKKQLVLPLGTSLISGQVLTTSSEMKNKFLYLDHEVMLHYDTKFVLDNQATVRDLQLRLTKQVEQLLNIAGFYTLTLAEKVAVKVIIACGMQLSTSKLILDFVTNSIEGLKVNEASTDGTVDAPIDTAESSEDDDFDENLPIDFGEY